MPDRKANLPFVPAYGEHFCVYCGFPFRGWDGRQQHCREYDLHPDHGRCAWRLQLADDPAGLRKRLAMTQKADPYSPRTGEYAVSHAWVTLHYPELDLQKWEPPHESTERVRREQLTWKREEVILAMDLYLRLRLDSDQSIPDQTSSELVQLSELLKRLSAYPAERQDERYRSPNSVHLKLTNLRAVQTLQAHGMSRHSQRDAAVWREFVDDRARLHAEAAALRARLQDGTLEPPKAESMMEDVDIEEQHTETFLVSPTGKLRVAERAEQSLVLSYRNYMAGIGVLVRRKKYLPAGEIRPLYSDAWVEERHALLEAKNSDSREAIRMAIGQLYDYRRFHQTGINLAVLLPSEPIADRLDLLRSASVAAVWQHGSVFRDSAGGAFV